MMDPNTDVKRARLIDLARGGDGHLEPWIERVTVQRPGLDDAPGYVLHLPDPYGGKEITIAADLELLRNLIIVLENGAQPRDPTVTAEQVLAERAARIAAMPTPEDHGRIVTPDEY